MSAARKRIATGVTVGGLVRGTVAAAGCFYGMWPAGEPSVRRDIFSDIRATLIVCSVVALPFVWLARLIDPSIEDDKE